MENLIDVEYINYIVLGVISVLGLIALHYKSKYNKISDKLISKQKDIHNIIRDLPIPIIVINKSTKKIVYLNDFIQKSYGLKSSQYIGIAIDTIYHNIDDIELENTVYKQSVEYKFGDNIKQIELSRIDIEYDNVDCIADIIIDKTKFNKLKEENDSLNTQLDKALNAKMKFLSKMKHEIMIPLNEISGMLSLLNKTNLDKTQRGYSQKAISSSMLLVGLINDILDFSKLESDAIDIDRQKFDIFATISNTLNNISILADSKDLELLFRYDKDIETFLIGDSLRLSQILTNLLSNSIKFTNKGEVILGVSKEIIDDKKIKLLFCIKDSGIGVSDNIRDKLFVDFNQPDEYIAKKFGGTGLGLSICKKLVTILGGEIWLEESIEGKGSEFCFNLEFEISSHQDKQTFKLPNRITTKQILIVDDHYISAAILKNILEDFGFSKIDIVYSSKDALMNIFDRQISYDMVFLDYKMNDINGIDTYLTLKEKLKDYMMPKVIMMIAYAGIYDNNMYNIGIDKFITKPFINNAIYGVIYDLYNSNITIIDDTSATYGLDGVRVLVAEDNETNQEFTLTLLQKQGIIVDIANDGLEAIEKIKTQNYDILLLDIKMPNLNGLETIKQIRQIEGQYYQDLPIFALDISLSDEELRDIYKLGFDEYIQKPIIPKTLFELMVKYLHNIDKEKGIELITHHILSVDESIKRLGNNKRLYHNLIIKYIKRYTNFLDDIEHLISTDPKKAYQKIFDIKSSSINIGANKLLIYLTKILDNIKNNQTVDTADILTAKDLLQDTIKDMQEYCKLHTSITN